MLVLSRKADETIIIGGGDSGVPEIKLMVVEIRGDKVRLGITCPREVPVHRLEVHQKIQLEQAAAAEASVSPPSSD